MSRIHRYPKIFNVGNEYIPNLFEGEVEVTEKIDGSQWGWGVDKEGNIVMRSKGKEVYFEDYENMFEKAVSWVDKNREKIKSWGNDTYFYGEFLSNPSHNILQYERVPKNNIMLFGARINGGKFVSKYNELQKIADSLGLEPVPILFRGEIKTFDELKTLLNEKSILGKEIIEGMVIKNFNQPIVIGNRPQPSFGKYVREKFKERHRKGWNKKFSPKNKLEQFINSFRTEARWQKTVQHLREAGELENAPRDIGKLLVEIEQDIKAEEKENIKAELYDLFIDQITRTAKGGFPEWYKRRLAENAFKNKENKK